MAARWSRAGLKHNANKISLFMFCTQIPPSCCIKIAFEQRKTA